VTDYVLIFGGGLLGSAHCVGMCGPFALALGTLSGSRQRWLRHVVYGLGRVFTYAAVGAVAGGLGHQIDRLLPSAQLGQGLFAIVAGMLLVLQGLFALGVPWPFRVGQAHGCQLGGLLGALIRATRLRNVFLAGMVNGLVPCGLVYAYLALALAANGPLEGGLLMATFGLGTMPVLVLLGMGSTLLSLRLRRRLIAVAAACILLTGVMTLWRGAAALLASQGESYECPSCVSQRENSWRGLSP
jgi:hypothetical protein